MTQGETYASWVQPPAAAGSRVQGLEVAAPAGRTRCNVVIHGDFGVHTHIRSVPTIAASGTWRCPRDFRRQERNFESGNAGDEMPRHVNSCRPRNGEKLVRDVDAARRKGFRRQDRHCGFFVTEHCGLVGACRRKFAGMVGIYGRRHEKFNNENPQGTTIRLSARSQKAMRTPWIR